MSEKLVMPQYDKSKWMRGEWDNEPDRVDFIHAGFSCFILRNYTGNWCGYVGVPSTHPSFGEHYNDVNVHVHGGLTYASMCNEHICHIPEPGMPNDVWWLGFDTAHAFDIIPGMPQVMSVKIENNSIYRNIEYVTNETKQLAEQLASLHTEMRTNANDE
jgi:hypothetical protein